MTDSQELIRLYLLQREKISKFERDIIIRTLYIHMLNEQRELEKK